jgi:hypothetical protein
MEMVKVSVFGRVLAFALPGRPTLQLGDGRLALTCHNSGGFAQVLLASAGA